jgi:DNA polymerase III epsilon subunit-like protein
MAIRCIDIETTGIDPAKDAEVEIASVDLLREGGITNRQETLVRPPLPVPAGSERRASPDRRGSHRAILAGPRTTANE